MKTKNELLIELERSQKRIEELENILAGNKSSPASSYPQARLSDHADEQSGSIRQMLLKLKDVVWIVSLDGGTVFEVNPAFEELYGRSIDEFKANPNLWLEVVHPDDQPAAKASLDTLFKYGHAETEYRILYPDGSIHWVLDRKSFIYDEQGSPVKIGGIASDITTRKQAQIKGEDALEKLRASENRFTVLFRSNPVPVGFTHASDFRIVDVNDAWSVLTGYTRAEALGHTSTELGLAKPQTLQHVRDLLQNQGEIHQAEILLYTRSGQEKRVMISSEPIEINGESYLLNILLDVTESRMADQRIRESEENYKALFESNPHPMWVYDLQTLAFLTVNEAAIQHYGYSREEFLSMTLLDIRPTEDARRLMENVAEVADGLDEAGSWRHVKKDGTIIDVEITSHTLDYYGHKAEIVLSHDITARKQAEDKLSESEKVLRAFIEQSHDGIMLSDAQGKIIEWNTALTQISGLKRDDMLGRNSWDVQFQMMTPEKRSQITAEQLKTAMQSVMQEKHHPKFDAPGEFEIQTPQGERKFLAQTSFPIYSQAGYRLGAIVRDITARKQADEKLRESEARFATAFFTNPAPQSILSLITGQVLEVNESTCRLFGYSREELIGVEPGTLNLWAEPAEQLAALEELQVSGHLLPRVVTIRKKSGETRSIIFTAEQINWKTEPCLITSSLDITERKQTEQTLRETEERLALVMEGSQLGYWDWNMETGEVYRNARWAEMLGFTLEEIEFNVRQWTDLIHPDDRDLASKSIQDHLEGKTSAHRKEYRMRTKDGQYKWILDQARVVKRASDGKPLRMSGTHTDITERKRAEQKLRESEERFRNLFETSHDPILVVDHSTNRFVTVNQSAIQMYGYTLDEFLALRAQDVSAEPEKSVAAIKNKDTFIPQRMHRRKDGTIFPAEITGGYFIENGRSLHTAYIRDVTERKLAEEKLRESEHRYTLLFQKSNFPVILVKLPEVVIADVNEAAEKLTGFSRDEMIGSTSAELGLINNRQRTESVSRFKQAGVLAVNEMRIITKTGEERIISFNTNPIEINGQPFAFTSMQDITERKQAEEDLRESEQRFAAIFEHSPVAIGISRFSDGKIVQTNSAFSNLYGFAREEILGHTTLELGIWANPKDRQHFVDLLKKDQHVDALEVTAQRKSGEERKVLVWGEWLEIAGQPYMMAQMVDITERKQAEALLTRRLEDLALINNMNNAVNHGGDLVEITEMLAQSAKKVFGSQSASLYLLSPDKKHLLLQHYTMAGERVARLEKLIGRSVPQIELPIGGDDHFSRVLASDGGFLIAGPKDVGAWLADFLKTSFLPANVRPLLQKIVPAAVKLLNIDSVVSIPLKVGDDLMGVIEFIAEGDFAEGTLERLRNVRHQLSEVILRKRTEHDLVESNEKYRLLSEELEERVEQRTAELQDLYDNAPAGYHSLDEAGCFMQINQTELNWLGYSRNEVIGHPLADFVTAKGLATFKENFPSFKQHGWLKDLEMEFLRKDGTTFYTLVNAAAIKDETGRYVMSRSTVVDITARRQAEQALRNSEASLQNFLDTAHDLIQSLDEQGKFLYVNNAWCATLGYSLEEALHLTMFDVIVPEHHAACREMLKQLVVGKEPDRVEVVFKTKQGQAVIVEGHVNSRKNANGTLATNGIFRDITLRKQADEALKASETKYRQLFENMNEGFSLQEIITDESGQPVDFRYLDANSVFEHHSGISPQKVIGRTTREVFPQADPRSIQTYGKVALTGESISLEYFSTAINRYVSVRAFSPKYGQFATIFEDITERKRAEEMLRVGNEQLNMANAALEKAMRVKDEFLASMSHELRTPLTGILGLSESMQMDTYGELNERQKKITKSIYDSGQHLLDLINDILDLSKIEAGKLEIQRYPTLFADICRASLQLTKGMAHQKHLQVSSVIPDEPIILNLDMRRIKQVIVNLLSNAIKFTPEGGELGLVVEPDEAHERVRLIIWDKGIGIKPEDLPRLFQPFTQIDSDLAREYSGTGLGLSLVKSLVEMHQGSVEVESVFGEGSRFTVTLPWVVEDSPSNSPRSENTPPDQPGSNPREAHSLGTVLIADDNQIMLNMLTDFLEGKNFNIVGVQSGIELLQKIEEIKPNVILMDVQMPGMDGLVTIRHIRSHADPVVASTRIIAVTALAMVGDRERCLAAGANDYMSKPVKLKELKQMIESQLGGSKE